MFTQAVITLPSGKTLTINGNGAADNAPYVQSATWNGSAWNNALPPVGDHRGRHADLHARHEREHLLGDGRVRRSALLRR